MFEKSSIDDLNMMLARTVVLYNKWPVFLHEVVKGRLALCSSLATQKEKLVPIDDPLFDFTPVPLGFVNSETTAAYTARRGVRKMKQGLSRDNLQVTQIGKTPEDEALYHSIRDLNTKYLVPTIKENYPTLKECLEAVSTDAKIKAFHKNFAVAQNFVLLYKDKTVGLVDSDNGKLVFRADKTYLKTLLEN